MSPRNFDDRTPSPARSPAELLRWKVLDPLLGRGVAKDRSGFRAPVRTADPAALLGPAPSLTWIGHATFLARLGGKLVATDPVFSKRLGGAVARRVPPALTVAQAPPIDVVTVSHNHLDHLDLPSLRQIGPRALYIVPLGNGRWLQRAGLTRIVELDWWQTHREGDLEVTLVPARHWSQRAPWTRNQALWGGFVLRSPEGTVYHAGDTAYFDGFKEIGERLGPIDWALLPIGAYEPRWFMQSQHLDPDEAGQAFLDLGARTLVAMHWGTFRLTDEPLGEPPERIRAFFRSHGFPEERLWVMDIGENRRL